MRKTCKHLRRDAAPTNRISIYRFQPRNESQAIAHRSIQHNDLTVLLGPAGCGKTYVATAAAVEAVLAGRVDTILLTRPVVEAGEHLGFLPGDLHDKVAPYMAPLHDSVAKICGGDERRAEAVRDAIEVVPLAFMRGMTFDRTIMILDEAQNCSPGQLKMFCTRLGEGSKILITGDPDQSDLPERDQCFADWVDRVEGVDGVGVVEFDESEIVRHPLIGRLLRVL